jgi:hypothetical protein
MSLEGTWQTVKEHKLLFGAIAAIVALYFLWPSSSSTSSTSNQSAIDASEDASIAAASQANAQLTLASDQVNAIGIETAAQTAQNAANNAAAVSEAGIAAKTQQAGIAAQLNALQTNDSTQIQLSSLVNQSQDLGQNFIEQLEERGLNTPSFQTQGLTAGSTGTQTNNLSAQVQQTSLADQLQAALAATQASIQIDAANNASAQAIDNANNAAAANAQYASDITQMSLDGLNVGKYSAIARQGPAYEQQYFLGT